MSSWAIISISWSPIPEARRLASRDPKRILAAVVDFYEVEPALLAKRHDPHIARAGRSLAVPPPHRGHFGRARRVARPFPSRKCPEPHASPRGAIEVAAGTAWRFRRNPPAGHQRGGRSWPDRENSKSPGPAKPVANKQQRLTSRCAPETKNANWKEFKSLKQTFGSADQVGNCVAFDVGNNRYRLIGRISYRYGMLYVLKVMDHKEYDKGLRIERCGCNTPPPKQ
jgi:mRNA-degrading endonuclease HigB of HigAB toxin-antitoxin module